MSRQKCLLQVAQHTCKTVGVHPLSVEHLLGFTPAMMQLSDMSLMGWCPTGPGEISQSGEISADATGFAYSAKLH